MPDLLKRMSDDALIRVENLRKTGKTAVELASAIGSSYQYWRDMLDGKKSFGEKIARKIEGKLGLPRGWLDTINNSVPPMTQPPEQPYSAFAHALAVLFDQLPNDVRVRADVLVKCTAVVQDAMRPSEQPSPAPARSDQAANSSE